MLPDTAKAITMPCKALHRLSFTPVNAGAHEVRVEIEAVNQDAGHAMAYKLILYAVQ